MDAICNDFTVLNNSGSDSGIYFVFGYLICESHENYHSGFSAEGRIMDNSWNHDIGRPISLFSGRQWPIVSRMIR